MISFSLQQMRESLVNFEGIFCQRAQSIEEANGQTRAWFAC